MAKLLADSGATKCEWTLINKGKTKTIFTIGISPYFLNGDQIVDLLNKELLPSLKKVEVEEVDFYGTGLANPNNATIISKALRKVFGNAKVEVNTDMLAAARALCGREKGIACILGTGSNCCYYNGKKIVKNSPSLGFILGDEGSGAYLGKKVVQHFLYDTFDEDLRSRFDAKFVTNRMEILESVYKSPMPNRYLAQFAIFLAENRGNYMIENIIEDGLYDFFLNHLCNLKESFSLPINFIGSVAFGFKDVLQDLCNTHELQLGKVLKNPMEGLIKYHSEL